MELLLLGKKNWFETHLLSFTFKTIYQQKGSKAGKLEKNRKLKHIDKIQAEQSTHK